MIFLEFIILASFFELKMVFCYWKENLVIALMKGLFDEQIIIKKQIIYFSKILSMFFDFVKRPVILLSVSLNFESIEQLLPNKRLEQNKTVIQIQC